MLMNCFKNPGKNKTNKTNSDHLLSHECCLRPGLYCCISPSVCLNHPPPPPNHMDSLMCISKTANPRHNILTEDAKGFKVDAGKGGGGGKKRKISKTALILDYIYCLPKQGTGAGTEKPAMKPAIRATHFVVP